MFRFHQFRAQSRQSAKLSKLSLQSSELGPPPPHRQASVHHPPPLVPGRGHIRLRERGWGSPNSDEGRDTVDSKDVLLQQTYQDMDGVSHFSFWLGFIDLKVDGNEKRGGSGRRL